MSIDQINNDNLNISSNRLKEVMLKNGLPEIVVNSCLDSLNGANFPFEKDIEFDILTGNRHSEAKKKGKGFYKY